MLLTGRYNGQTRGVLSCLDRVVRTGTLLEFEQAPVATGHLNRRGIRIFHFSEFAKGLENAISANAERVAERRESRSSFQRSAKVDKGDHVRNVLAERGMQPRLVCILSVMETCTSYKPWHDMEMHKTYLKPDCGKCVHYHFYLIDEVLGLCDLRVPTWAPYRLQFHFNGLTGLPAGFAGQEGRPHLRES